MYLGRLVVIKPTAGDAALLLLLARSGDLVMFEALVSPSDA